VYRILCVDDPKVSVVVEYATASGARSSTERLCWTGIRNLAQIFELSRGKFEYLIVKPSTQRFLDRSKAGP